MEDLNFTAKEDIIDVIEGVPCRFLKDRHYTVDGRNPLLIKNIVDNYGGKISVLPDEDGKALVAAQGVADRARKAEARAQRGGMHSVAPGPIAGATVKTEG